MSRMAEAAYGDSPIYPDAPGYKTGGTSKDAARAITGKASILRDRVFAAIAEAGARGMTADEAATALGETVLAVRPRVSELAKATPARIIPTGERRKNESGLAAKCWRAI